METVNRIAIIPARGGSKRIPRKNIADMNGRPIIAYAIDTCRSSGLFAEVVVSTEDAEIAAIAARFGATIDDRPADLSGDRVPATAVCEELLNRRYSSKNLPEQFCLVYPFAAFLHVEDLQQSAAMMEGRDGVLGVSRYPIHPYKAMVNDGDCLRPLWPENNMQQSQNFPDAFAANGTFCWARSNAFLIYKTFYFENLAGHIMPYDRAVDIDTPEDLARARNLMRLKMQGSDGQSDQA